MKRVRKSSRPSGGKLRIGSPSRRGIYSPICVRGLAATALARGCSACPNPLRQSSDTAAIIEDTGRIMKHSLALFLLLAGAAHSQETKFLSLTARIDLPNVNG